MDAAPTYAVLLDWKYLTTNGNVITLPSVAGIQCMLTFCALAEEGRQDQVEFALCLVAWPPAALAQQRTYAALGRRWHL